MTYFQGIYIYQTGFEVTNFGNFKFSASSHHTNLHSLADSAVNNTYIQNYTFVSIKLGVKHQRFQGFRFISTRGRNFRHNCFQYFFNANASFCTTKHCVRSINTDNVLYLTLYVVRVSTRQVNFIYNRNNFQIIIQGKVHISQSLCFDALGGVNYEKRTLARSQSTGNFVGKVYVTGGIDKVKHILFAIASFVNTTHCLRFDSNATFTLQIHGVKNLLFHLTLGKSTGMFNQSVCQGRFAMVDMGNNGKITDFTLIHC